MNNATNKTYEIFEHGTSGFWGVRCRETGTQTLTAMSKRAALRILRSLGGSLSPRQVESLDRDELLTFAVG